MHFATFGRLVVASAILTASFGTQAQTVAPIKPGLWQVHIDREVDGQKAPDPSDHLKNMTPEKRAQVEAMMKQHGIAMASPGMNQVCYTAESLERAEWANQESGCKTDFTSRTATSWKWHSTCPKYSYVGDGEAIFSDRENYTVKSTSVSKISDKARNSRMTITGKWLGADCGDLKPLNPKP
jgi:hypothetical protein